MEVKIIDLGNGAQLKIYGGDGNSYHSTYHLNGAKCWYLNGKRHRTDGPAIEDANGSKSWWINGKLHRVDGPAVEYANGDKWWYINGKEYSEEEFNIIKEVLWML
jgi:hypothetical protein